MKRQETPKWSREYKAEFIPSKIIESGLEIKSPIHIIVLIVVILAEMYYPKPWLFMGFFGLLISSFKIVRREY